MAHISMHDFWESIKEELNSGASAVWSLQYSSKFPLLANKQWREEFIQFLVEQDPENKYWTEFNGPCALDSDWLFKVGFNKVEVGS